MNAAQVLARARRANSGGTVIDGDECAAGWGRREGEGGSGSDGEGDGDSDSGMNSTADAGRP